jgi:hypothetical protein
MCIIVPVFCCTALCDKNMLIVTGISLKNYPHNLGLGDAVCSTFIQNSLICNVCLHKCRVHKFSDLLPRSVSVLPGKGLEGVFSCQMSYG